MASTESLPSGRFRGIYRDSAGDKRHVQGTFRLKSEAQKAANDAESIARRQVAIERGTLSASITWDQWWEVLSADREFESDTDVNERSIIRKHISPHWGETELNRIKRSEVQNWVNALKKKRTPKGSVYKPSYVRDIYKVFAYTINAALKTEPPVLLASPLTGVELPSIRKRQKPFIAMEDAPTLAATLRQDYADALGWLLETGCRPGEVCGLHDDQVDVTGRVLTVRTVYVPRKKRMRDHPKDEDVREIPLSKKAMEIYLRRTADRNMKRSCGVEHFGGRQCRAELVFRTERGLVMEPAAFRAAFIRAADRVELARLTPYAGRRGFATRLARGGMDIFEMMEVMGWSKPELAREYVQQTADARGRLMAALGDPEATTLRVVGQNQPRGTEHGTQSDQQPSAGSRTPHRRKTS